jgi:uncharacterized repeat protein (TIGR02543 family)
MEQNMNYRALVTGLSILFLRLFLGNTAGASLPTYTLMLATYGQGTIALSPAGGVYASNTLVAVTATPAAGWVFTGWSGAATGAANPASVTMSHNLSLAATFAQLPAIDVQPQNLTNTLGTTADFVAHAVGSPPLAYQWYFNNAPLSYATSSTLTMTNASYTNAGNYWLVATNSYGSATSSVVVLVVTAVQLPAIDVQPQNLTNTLGSTVRFIAHAIGSPPLAYRWYFNNDPLWYATSSTLRVTNASSINAGNYWLVATNSYGSATSSVVELVLITNTVQVPTEEALRAAIALGGWVSINCSGTFTLSAPITITNDVILDAQNESVAISGNNAVRLFYVAPGGSLTATNLVLANGSVTNNPADGGGIYNDGGTVVLVSCVLTNNNAQVQLLDYLANYVMRGGAIFNRSDAVSLFRCGISNNAATAWSPAPFPGGGTWSVFGGAVYNTGGTIQMVACNCSSNSCQPANNGNATGGPAMGGGVFQASGALLVTNSVFAFNQALAGNTYSSISPPAGPGQGGGLCATGGVVIIDHCQFMGNRVKGTDNKHATPGLGGAIYCSSALTVESSSFAWNQALSGNYGFYNLADGQGGAIYNAGSAVLNRSSIYSNYVQGSAGNESSLYTSPGGDGLGGGVYNSGLLMVTNCTIALNSAIAGSGVELHVTGAVVITTNGMALGGGVYNGANATSRWMNVTIASNFCIASGTNFLGTNGFSAGAQIANKNRVVWLRNSLLAYSGTNGNVWGTAVTDAGFNISDDGSAAFASGASYNFTDPRLGPLAYYGGPTPCMALLPDSPAIDTGNNAGAPATDQRGLARPYNGVVDRGAYELYGSNQVVNLPLLNLEPSGPNLLLSFTAYPPSLYQLQSSTNLLQWQDLETYGPFASPTTITRTISPQGALGQFYRVWAQ